MTGSALATPTFQAVNSNIANDGSADSPRGFGNVTTTGSFSVTKGGPSLYRVEVTSPAAPITATLPTDVKAGYRVRFEVELTSSTETNCFFTSPSIAAAQINGTGFVELMAKSDNPSAAGDWKVVDVEESVTLSSQTYTFQNGGTITGKAIKCSRNKTTVTVAFESGTATGSATNSGHLSIPIPSRFKCSGSYKWVCLSVVLAGVYQVGMYDAQAGFVYAAPSGSTFSSAASLQGVAFSPNMAFSLA